MAENFEFDRAQIKIRIIKLLREPSHKLLQLTPAISDEDSIRFQEIYFKVLGPSLEIYRHNSLHLGAIFPAFLSALDGDFSDARVTMLAEVLIEVVKSRLQTFL